jgi:drug/metabolite transporter (DMT)-like permease
LEPVFAALAAWWLIGERLSPSGWLGAALIVSALMLSQWADRGEDPPATV